MLVDHHNVMAIDYGTTTSSGARLNNNGSIDQITDRVFNQSDCIPSVVCYKEDKTLVGFNALREERKSPTQVIYDAKRMIGKRYDDEIIQELSKGWLFKIRKADDGSILIETCQGLKHPWEICMEVLKFLKENAESKAMGHKITHVVVSIPANYNTTQRKETLKAAKAAGFEKVHLISEPTAAVMNYWFNNFGSSGSFWRSKNVLIYDFGGGTLDVSLASVSAKSVDINAVEGNMLLGGRDFDNNLIDYYLKQKNLKDEIYQYLYRMDNYGRKARNDFHMIRDSCEEAKKSFVHDSEQSIMPNILNLEIDEQELIVSYDTFIQINKNLLDKILEPVERILKFCNMPKTEIDDIILVGGSSNIPIVATKLREYFQKDPLTDGEPRNVVVRGAAIEARRRFVTNEKIFTELTNLKYQDVCPLSLGTSSVGSRMVTLIPRNTKLPAKKTSTFISVENFQKKMTFYIHETESCLCTKDTFLGSLTVDLPELQAGEAKVELELSLNEDCILKAQCHVVGYNDPKYISEKVIRQGCVLSQNFIESRIKDAELSKRKDTVEVDKNRVQRHWVLLHRNAKSFVNHFRPNVTVNKSVVLPKLDEILALAQAEVNKKCNDVLQYNNMVNRYKELFTEYNKDAPPHRQTKFLENAFLFK